MEKALLVIGASSEIGLGTIREIHGDYDVIFAHYNHMNIHLEHLKAELGEKLVCIQADLTDEAQTRALIQSVSDTGVVPAHILHFPAMAIQTRKFHKTDWALIRQELDISLRSAVLVLQAFLPKMAKLSYGRVVIMLSMAVCGTPPKYNADYVLTKHALLGLIKALSVEYADKGITVNGVSPALVRTRFVEHLHDFIIAQHAQMSPTGENLSVEDVVPVIKHLLSPGAADVNGQNICVTGGKSVE